MVPQQLDMAHNIRNMACDNERLYTTHFPSSSPNSCISIHNLVTRQLETSLQLEEDVRALYLTDRLLVVEADNSTMTTVVSIFSKRDWAVLYRVTSTTGQFRATACSDDRVAIMHNDGSISLVCPGADGGWSSRLVHPPVNLWGSLLTTGDWLALNVRRESIRLMDVRQPGAMAVLEGSEGGAWQMVLAPPYIVALAPWWAGIRIWDIRTGQVLVRLPGQDIGASFKGKFCSIATNGRQVVIFEDHGLVEGLENQNMYVFELGELCDRGLEDSKLWWKYIEHRRVKESIINVNKTGIVIACETKVNVISFWNS